MTMTKDMDNIVEIAKSVRKSAVTMAYEAGSSHVGTALSMIDILTVLYFKFLNINPKEPYKEDRDIFILSKGHGASGLYSVLAERGFFDKSLLGQYDKDGSKLGGHPKKNSVPGIEASTGSLGHGLPIACGIALSSKHSDIKRKIVVLMGDGECNEGAVWEAAMFAASRKLDNLIAIVDHNKLQGLGRVQEITGLTPLKEKWEAFGWNVLVIDGHNYGEIERSLETASLAFDIPTVILANTVKGKGISFMEDKLEWHYRSPNEELWNKALKELD